MKNITESLYDIYSPQKALIIYQPIADKQSGIYVEAYDMDEEGRPINAHPLSVEECSGLADALGHIPELDNGFLKPRGLLPEKVLYINPCKPSCAIWFTPSQEVNLLFKQELSIPCGKAGIPAMVWKATQDILSVYALRQDAKPTEHTKLCHAPFFNGYKDGRVCMGTVDVDIDTQCCLEDFMSQWEAYFFNSYFSHLLEEFCPVSVNIVQLWQEQVGSNKPFPTKVLIKNGMTLKDLIK